MPARAETIYEAINSSLSTRGLLADEPKGNSPNLGIRTDAGADDHRQYASFVKKIGGKEIEDHLAAIRQMVQSLTHQEGH
jgi:hypothetical protein